VLPVSLRYDFDRKHFAKLYKTQSKVKQFEDHRPATVREKIFPGYTSLIGKYKYSGLHNLSIHHLASYVITRRGLGFKEATPPVYDWALSQVEDFIEPHLKKSGSYRSWSMIHDLFEHSGITSFKTAEILKKLVLMKYVLNSVTSAQPDNLKAGLSTNGKIDDYHKTWKSINHSTVL
jgi:hypothetical protein